MAVVTFDQVQDKLITLDKLTTELEKTEPLDTQIINSETKVRFHLEPEWAQALDALPGTAPVDVTVRINGTEHQMTKEAVLQAASEFGLQSTYVKKTPANLIEEHLNYWYSGGYGNKEMKTLQVGERISAFIKPSIVPFSNLQLLDRTVESIRKRYGSDAQIWADYKFQNSLVQTDARLIVPAESREITDTGTEADNWSAGIHLSNSLSGKKKTSLEAYLFRWWCTNGCTTNFAEAGIWNRKLQGQNEDVYEWAAESVDEILGGLEHRFNEVQALTQISIAGNAGDVAREIMDQYSIPISQRTTITDALLEQPTLTMYGMMQAITQVANTHDISAGRADDLMRIGGELPTASFDPLKARIYAEGQLHPTDPNPYEIRTAASL
jgi:hypothetical protein